MEKNTRGLIHLYSMMKTVPCRTKEKLPVVNATAARKKKKRPYNPQDSADRDVSTS